MGGLNIAMETGRTGLLARQQQLNIAANNLAHMDTDGYHRQVAELGNNVIVSTPTGEVGTGVHVEQITRRYNLSLEKSLQHANQEEGEARLYLEELSSFEGVIAPSGDSALGDAVSQFAASLQELANRPEAVDSRAAVMQQGEEVAYQFTDLHQRMSALRDGIVSSSNEGSLATRVEQLNTMAGELAVLNGRISETENRAFNPISANDLRDQRDQLMADMSKLADVSFAEETDTTYTVTLDGHDLVSGTTADSLVLDVSSGSPQFQWSSDGSAVSISDGEIAGQVNAFTYFQNRIGDLEDYGAEFAAAVNTAQQAGYDLNNDNEPAEEVFNVSTSGTWSMQMMISDPNELAAAAVADAPGDGANAVSMWNALNQPVAALQDDTLVARADSIVDQVARDVDAANTRAQTTSASQTMFLDAVDAVSGVSVDEEMMHMLEIQRAYQGSAKVISTVDQMLATVINAI